MVCVSIILPNYNHEKYLDERINSILHQSFQDFELIILDDCSSDYSIDVLSKYRTHPKVSNFIVNKKNTGSTFSQWNYGVSLARGKYIWIAESDDIAEKDFLESLVPILESSNNLSLAYCQSLQIDQYSVVNGSWFEWTKVFKERNIFNKSFVMNGEEFINTYMFYRNVIPNASAVVFRKEIYNDVGGSEETLRSVGDWYLWVKLLSKGDIYFASQELNFFRRHSESVIGKELLKNNKPEIILNSQLMLNKALHKYFNSIGNERMKNKYRILYSFSKAVFFLLCIMHFNFNFLRKKWIVAEINGFSILYYISILLYYKILNLIRNIFGFENLNIIYIYAKYLRDK